MEEFVKKRPLSLDSTESSSSEETVPLKVPKDLLGLGGHLVRELGLRDSTDTMGRWLAHHLAELMTESRNRKALAAHRVEARKQATDLILKIWERRNLLPGNAYPLAPYKDILRVLGFLRSDGNPWNQRRATPYQVTAASIYDRLSRLVIGLLLVDLGPLLRRRTRRGNESLKFLNDEEREIFKELERWLDVVDGSESLVAHKPEFRHIDVRAPLQKLAEGAIKELSELQQRLAADTTAGSATAKTPQNKGGKPHDPPLIKRSLRTQTMKRK
jgi:hypothetical protein